MFLVDEFSTLEQAYIAAGMLSANGIEASVSADAISSIFPAPDAGTGRICLYVANENDLEPALKLLHERGE